MKRKHLIRPASIMLVIILFIPTLLFLIAMFVSKWLEFALNKIIE